MKYNSEIYEEIYEKPYHVKWLGKYKGYEEQIKLAIKLARGSKILDIGCGEGVITSKLQGNKVIGVDISKSAIKYAKTNYENVKISFFIASATNLPFKDDYFDCVSAFMVIEHLTQEGMHRCLEEIKRVCKPHGKVVISTPNLSSIYYVFFHSLGIKHKEDINVMDFIQMIDTLSKYFTTTKMFSNTETPWLKNIWFTKLVSKTQNAFLKLFPKMKHLFHNQIYVIARNNTLEDSE